MKIPVFQIDAFTYEPFSGNPAAVCQLDEWLTEEQMLQIAEEMNLSETAFFVKRRDGDFDLRWFTPTVEVDLCGHATLASTFVITERLETDRDLIGFHTRSGYLTASRNGDLVTLDFPINRPSQIDDADLIEQVAAALGDRPLEVWSANTTIAVYENENQVRNLKPDFDAVAQLPEPWVAATARGSETGIDFISRFFVPTAGINEDPVTGSSHTILAPYWANRLGKTDFTARQISRRGGTLKCEVRGDRVLISGKAVQTLEGVITLP